MKRRDLLARIGDAAKTAEVEWVMVREGANHEVWRCGGQRVVVPRHREINEYTAESILRDLAVVFGEGWWR